MDAPNPNATAELSLADLPLGHAARIERIAGADAIGQRLRDLGFRPGAEVRCERRAPLGEPRLYEVLGTRVCLRRSEAERVRIAPGLAVANG